MVTRAKPERTLFVHSDTSDVITGKAIGCCICFPRNAVEFRYTVDVCAKPERTLIVRRDAYDVIMGKAVNGRIIRPFCISV
jgi:hypothetical protein